MLDLLKQDDYITGEEFFKGNKMTKEEYLSLKYLDTKSEKDIKKSYRLLNEEMLMFIMMMGTNSRTLLPIVHYTDKDTYNEAVELIW